MENKEILSQCPHCGEPLILSSSIDVAGINTSIKSMIDAVNKQSDILKGVTQMMVDLLGSNRDILNGLIEALKKDETP